MKTRSLKEPLSPLDSLFSFSQILIMLLMIVVLGSGIAVVYTQHLNRSLHISLQNLHETRDALHVEWSQLLLEQSTVSSDARVERIAIDTLKMKLPSPDQIQVVRP